MTTIDKFTEYFDFYTKCVDRREDILRHIRGGRFEVAENLLRAWNDRSLLKDGYTHLLSLLQELQDG
jgi:hypothetical protein